MPQLSRAVGDYAAGQMNDARRLQAQAHQLPDGDPRRAELERQADAIDANWGDKGVMRIGAHILIGGLAGGSGGAAGSAAGTLSAPFIANGLQQLGITGPLANTLTTIASTGAGVLGGRATGTPGGATSGGATALSEVTNNYLDHRRPVQGGGVRLSEREQYDLAAAGCAKSDPSACDRRDALAAESRRRDEQLAQACSSPATGALCNDLRGQAIAMGNTVTTTPQGFTYANSPLQTPLNVSTIGPIANPSTNTPQTQIAQGVTDGLIGEVIGAPVGMAVGATVRGGRALVAEVRGGTGAAADVAGTGGGTGTGSGAPAIAATDATAGSAYSSAGTQYGNTVVRDINGNVLPAGVTSGARPVGGPVAAAPTPVARQNEVLDIFSTGQGSVNVGGSTYSPASVVNGRRSGALMDGPPMSQQQAEVFFSELTGNTNVTWRNVPSSTNHQGGQLATYSDPTTGTVYNLRSFSSSSGNTGPVWTVEIQGSGINTQLNSRILEIKFPRK